jgi:UDP-N-acetylglucosamine:LPS N-acetylglucosamine transferase
MRKVLILTSGFSQTQGPTARHVRDALESAGGLDVAVEVVDLLETCYGGVHDLMHGLLKRSPQLRQGLFSLLRGTSARETGTLGGLHRARAALDHLIRQLDPDVVCTTHAVYNLLIDQWIAGGRSPSFRVVSWVEGLRQPDRLWGHVEQTDLWAVSGSEAAMSLREWGIPADKIVTTGFPVAPERPDSPPERSGAGAKILYVVNGGRKKARTVVEGLLELKIDRVTVVVGADRRLREELVGIGVGAAGRLVVEGRSGDIADLLAEHDVVVGRARDGLVYEALASACPMILVDPEAGEEEELGAALKSWHAGAVAGKAKEVSAWAGKALKNGGELLGLWRENARLAARPDSSLRIARLVLEQARPAPAPRPQPVPVRHRPAGNKEILWCDLHTHTTYSDGRLSVRELVEFYGQRGFDALCITDHICDHKKLLGKFCNLTGLVLSPDRVEEYFQVIREEKERAWWKYGMILMVGLEFNKDGLTAGSSTHLLGVDLERPIDPSLDLKEIIAAIHAQNGLAIAAHPHRGKSLWGKDTLYLWENREEFAPLIDAWEIGNREDLYNPVGLHRLPFMANSDFHKPKHIYSWKTVLHCEKSAAAIKECIRINRDISISLYRDRLDAAAETWGEDEAGSEVSEGETVYQASQPNPMSTRPKISPADQAARARTGEA